MSHIPVLLGDYFTTEVAHILGVCPFLRLTFAVASGLATSLVYSVASEYLHLLMHSSTDPTHPPSSLMMTKANLTRLEAHAGARCSSEG